MTGKREEKLCLAPSSIAGLADDPDLHYSYAAEIKLLLEEMGKRKG